MQRIFWLLSILILSEIARSQAKSDTTLKLEDIQLSSAPAFSLLDISPSSIQKPTSTKAFTTSVLSNLSSGVPQNYALEVAPYWFMKHPHLTSAKYMGLDNSKMGYNPSNKAKFAAVSFAIVNKDSSTNVGSVANHNVSLGVRATILSFYRSDDIAAIRNATKGWLNSLQNNFGNGPVGGNVNAINAYENATKGARDSLTQALKANPVFSLDIAAATNMAFDSNSITSNRLNRSGVWLNLNLALPLNKSRSNYFNLSALGRYIYDKDSMNTKGQYINSNFWDYGFQVQLVFQNFSAAYEYVARKIYSTTNTNTFKSVGIIQYKVKDGVFLTGSFGQNFPNTNNLITAIGLNWGISNGNEKIETSASQTANQ